MNKKVLFCATVDYHFKAFHLPYLQWFQEQGWEVHVAAKGNLDLPFVDKKYDLSIERSPFKPSNIKGFRELKGIIKENKYQIIHCHTPMGGMIARLAARSARKSLGTKVIYTAHGFHFCKGAPFRNWLLYYPIERWMARYTDCLITINQEDFQRATRHRFKARIIDHVHGVGVDVERFKPVDQEMRNILREQMEYAPSDFLLIYAAEFNKNKNQQFLLRALSLVKKEVPNTKLLLAGDGPLLEECKKLSSELDLTNMVDFLGYRNDLDEILPMCDVAVASSLREGLPVNIMEAMACGLPILATQNRGHSELVSDSVNGYITMTSESVEFAKRLIDLSRSNELHHSLSNQSLSRVLEFSLPKVREEMEKIYSRFMLGETHAAKS